MGRTALIGTVAVHRLAAVATEMDVQVAQTGLAELEIDLLAVGLFDGGELPPELATVPGAGDARGGFRKLTLLRPERPSPVLVVGRGARVGFDAERGRGAAAGAVGEAGAQAARINAQRRMAVVR